MKLGIAVVYLVHERDEGILDLHLRQIERTTEVPYTIYGDVSRLQPRLRAKLERRPDFRACTGAELERSAHWDPEVARYVAEHSSQLERLVECAVDDGATHVVVLHVDSFPVRAGWIQALTERLAGSCVLSAVMRHRLYDQKPSTICMGFPRELYLDHRPRFLISPAERALPAYGRYKRAFELTEDSGSGYGFKLFREGLAWHPLMDTRDGEARNGIGSVYGDLVFHLGGAVRYGNRRAGGAPRRLGLVALHPLRELVKPLLPRRVRRFLTVRGREIVADAINSELYERMRSRLLEAPDALLAELRAAGG